MIEEMTNKFKEETNSFTELVDIYPTLCELTGITPPNYLQGKSLTPVLKNPEIILKDEIYTRYKQGEAVIDKNYAYTEFIEGNKFLGNMLYDMTNDIGNYHGYPPMKSNIFRWVIRRT